MRILNNNNNTIDQIISLLLLWENIAENIGQKNHQTCFLMKDVMAEKIYKELRISKNVS